MVNELIALYLLTQHIVLINRQLYSGDFYPNFGKLQPGCLENLRLPLFGVVGIPAPIRSFGNTISKYPRLELLMRTEFVH